jgi:hypothetical protein
VFTRPKSRLFDPDNVVKAQVFFDRHGSMIVAISVAPMAIEYWRHRRRAVVPEI